MRRAAVHVVATVLGDAHVHRLEQRPAAVGRVALGQDPVEAADVPGQQAVAVVVEDLHGPDASARGDADDAHAVVEGTDRAGDVRAVAFDVAPLGPVARRAVVATTDVEVGVRGDAGVDDRHVRIHPGIDAVDAGDRAEQRPDARHAGRDDLGGQLGHLVGDDRDDVRVLQQGEPLILGQAGREPADGLAERPVGGDLVARRVAGQDDVRVRAGGQHDDEAAGRVRAAVGVIGRLRGRHARLRGRRRGRRGLDARGDAGLGGGFGGRFAAGFRGPWLDARGGVGRRVGRGFRDDRRGRIDERIAFGGDRHTEGQTDEHGEQDRGDGTAHGTSRFPPSIPSPATRAY